MAATVVSVTQLPSPMDASGLQNADARATLLYTVELSEQDADGARIARTASGIPVENDALGSTGMVVLRKRAEFESGDESGIHYRVTVEYGIDSATGGSGTTGEPWTRKDRVRRSVKAYQIAQGTDLDGVGIENSAGDPLAGGLVFDLFNPVRIINRFRRFTDFDPDAAEAHVGTVNDSAVIVYHQSGNETIAAGEALLRSITCNDAIWTATNTYYYDITLEVEIFGQVPIEFYYATNKGPFYIDTSDGDTKKPYVKTVVVNGREVPVAGEALLLNTGDLATGNYVGYDWTTDDQNYDLKFRRARRANWNWWTS